MMILVVWSALCIRYTSGTYPAFDESVARDLVELSWRKYPDVVGHFAERMYSPAPDIYAVHQVGPGQAKGASSLTKASILTYVSTARSEHAMSVLVATFTYVEYYGYELAGLRVLDTSSATKFLSKETYTTVIDSYISDADLNATVSSRVCTALSVNWLANNHSTAISPVLKQSTHTVSGVETDINIREGCSVIATTKLYSTIYYSHNVAFDHACISSSNVAEYTSSNMFSDNCDISGLQEDQLIDPLWTGQQALYMTAKAIASTALEFLVTSSSQDHQRAQINIPSVTLYESNYALISVQAIYYTGEITDTPLYLPYTVVDNRVTLTGGVHEIGSHNITSGMTDGCFSPVITSMGCESGTELLVGATRAVSISNKPCRAPVFYASCAHQNSQQSFVPKPEKWVDWKDISTVVGVCLCTLFFTVALFLILFT